MKIKKGIFLLAPFLILLLLAIYFRKLLSELPSPEDIKEYKPILSSKIYDRNGELFSEFYIQKRTWCALSEIPLVVRQAVIAMEDKEFYKHNGISYIGILRAIYKNILKRGIFAGGSTITQQLAKLAFLTPERTISRKIKELLLTIQLESNFSKDEILEMYLNQAYFGEGIYGISRAAEVYFSKPISKVTLPEAAMLAGLIRYPHYYSPYRYPRRAFWRRSTVLKLMRKLKFISKEDEIAANLEPINLQRRSVPITSDVASYFVEYIRQQLDEKYGADMVYSGGLKIYTTIDPDIQKHAEEIFEYYLSEFDKRRYKLTKSTEKVQGALIVLDVKTGEILAMIGGRNFRESQFNRAVQAYRQPGSAFKPIVLAAALSKGYTPATIINDTPLIYLNDGRNWRLVSRTTCYILRLPSSILNNPMRFWAPENFDDKYYNKVTLRRAIELSLNSCMVQTIENIGPNSVIEMARELKISSPLTNTYSLALGASEVSLLELLVAYNAFANNGVLVRPYSIRAIYDKHDKPLEKNKPMELGSIKPEIAYIITNILKGVIKRGTAAVHTRDLEFPCAGKTGTTNDYTDAWFIGYTPDIICGVWVGYDDKVTLGKRVTGAVIACPIWTDLMKRIVKSEENDFEIPENITFVYIDPETGLLSRDKEKVFLEAFIQGTEPKDYVEDLTSRQN